MGVFTSLSIMPEHTVLNACNQTADCRHKKKKFKQLTE